MALAEHSTIPYSRAQRMWGSVICENICIPSFSRYGYRKLCLPNVSTNIRPAMIGDMVSGRSMSVDMIFLPRKVNLVMSHAA